MSPSVLCCAFYLFSTHDNDTMRRVKLHTVSLLSSLHTLRQLHPFPPPPCLSAPCCCLEEKDTHKNRVIIKKCHLPLNRTFPPLFFFITCSFRPLSHKHDLQEKRVTLQLFTIRFFSYSPSHYVWHKHTRPNNGLSLSFCFHQQLLQLAHNYLHEVSLRSSARTQI